MAKSDACPFYQTFPKLLCVFGSERRYPEVRVAESGTFPPRLLWVCCCFCPASGGYFLLVNKDKADPSTSPSAPGTFKVSLRKQQRKGRDGQLEELKVGLETRFRGEADVAGTPGIVVDKILRNSLLARWNEENSDNVCVSPGDCIVAVNGVSGSVKQMLKEISSAETLEMKVERSSSTGAAGGADKAAAKGAPTPKANMVDYSRFDGLGDTSSEEEDCDGRGSRRKGNSPIVPASSKRTSGSGPERPLSRGGGGGAGSSPTAWLSDPIGTLDRIASGECKVEKLPRGHE